VVGAEVQRGEALVAAEEGARDVVVVLQGLALGLGWEVVVVVVQGGRWASELVARS